MSIREKVTETRTWVGVNESGCIVCENVHPIPRERNHTTLTF